MGKKGDDVLHVHAFDHPSGGWTSVHEVAHSLLDAHVPGTGSRVLLKQNKPDGFACVSCAWAKPAHPHPFEFCEHGAKATAWELTRDRASPAFFEAHTLRELERWSDHDLEAAGRLTAPMRWDAGTDRYLEVPWEQAFDEIGAELRLLAPKSVVFYTSGRASLETSYMFQLLARMYGCNNLPDSSNMCHESTSVGLPQSIGVPVGTITLDDFEHTDCIFTFGQNVGTNSPRMLHELQSVRRRGVPIVTFNPLREPGWLRFANPQSPVDMLTPKETVISTQYHQLRPGSDSAALMGLCKAVLETDAVDRVFIDEHTHGFDRFAEAVAATPWTEIESLCGLTRAAIEAAAAEYARAKRVMVIYGMGVTQQRRGVQNVHMLCNLLLLGGHIGRPGAGVLPVRGHSNVQGQRTVGITEKPELAPLDKLKELYGFEPPRDKGLNAVESCEGLLNGSVRGFVSLGGNFIRAVPDTARMETAWRRLRLSVQVATKLNRSHVVHGEVAYLLPCLGRLEIDRQGGGEQSVSIEDSTACIHGSRGQAEPASDQLRSEPAIVAGLAKALFGRDTSLPWDEWVADYGRIRAAIEKTYPDVFHDFEARMWTPGGFHRPLPAKQRVWKTQSGKANFLLPTGLDADPGMPVPGGDVLRLTTLRSFDQFNTTIYGDNDRYRGISGTRRILMMNAGDMARLGLHEGDQVDVTTAADDGVVREVTGLRVVPYDIPAGCVAGYYPECNPLVPLWHHAEESKVPAFKSIPIRLRPVAMSQARSR